MSDDMLKRQNDKGRSAVSVGSIVLDLSPGLHLAAPGLEEDVRAWISDPLPKLGPHLRIGVWVDAGYSSEGDIVFRLRLNRSPFEPEVMAERRIPRRMHREGGLRVVTQILDERHQELVRLLRAGRPSYICPRCHMTSFQPEDIKNRYCGNCREFEEARRRVR